MNKVYKRAAAACVLLGIAVFLLYSGRKPFKNLKPSEITAASVRLLPPDKTIQLTETEIEELAGYLNDVAVYHKDNSYTEYNGQSVIFSLTMADGSRTEIMESNPFLVIDGVGYQTKYGPCEALNSYANRLAKSAD